MLLCLLFFFSLNDRAMLYMNNSKVADELAYIGIYLRCMRDKQSSIVLIHWDCLCYSSLHYLFCMIQHLYWSCFSSLGAYLSTSLPEAFLFLKVQKQLYRFWETCLITPNQRGRLICFPLRWSCQHLRRINC